LEGLRRLVAQGQVQGMLIDGPERWSPKGSKHALLLKGFGQAGVQRVFLDSTPPGDSPKNPPPHNRGSGSQAKKSPNN
jgi:hypothetical protein